MQISEIQYWEQLKQGNETVFEMFFRTYYQPLCNYAFTFVQDRDEAEEIVQNIFLSIWEKREAIDIRTSPKSYLYTMVRNACLNAIKHNKIKEKYVGQEMAVRNEAFEAVSHHVQAVELEKQIQETIETLPMQCRLIFKLSRFEELKYSEIAEQLNISIKTVENQMGKALRVLREQLKDYLPFLLIMMNGLY